MGPIFLKIHVLTYQKNKIYYIYSNCEMYYNSTRGLDDYGYLPKGGDVSFCTITTTQHPICYVLGSFFSDKIAET
jgi:hypothetical protein